jgi:hypothetical protein
MIKLGLIGAHCPLEPTDTETRRDRYFVERLPGTVYWLGLRKTELS